MLRAMVAMVLLAGGNQIATASVQVRAFVDKRSGGYNAELIVQARQGSGEWKDVVLGPVSLADSISSVRTWGNRVAWVRHSNSGYKAVVHCVQVNERFHAREVVLGIPSLGAVGIHSVHLIGDNLAWVRQNSSGYREHLHCVVIDGEGHARDIALGVRSLGHRIRTVIVTGTEIRWVSQSENGDERNCSEALPRARG